MHGDGTQETGYRLFYVLWVRMDVEYDGISPEWLAQMRAEVYSSVS